MTGSSDLNAGERLVLFAEYTDLDPEPARDLLQNHGIRAELLRLEEGRVDSSQAHAVGMIAGYSRISSELIDQLPSLGIIATTSNGVDMVDVEYAVSRGIWVTNVGHAATEEVATHTLALALAAVREIPAMQASVRAGGWTDDLDVRPRRLSELTLGVVGYGRIGAMFAALAAPLFRKTIAFDPFRPPHDGAAEPASLEQVFAEADVISLHLPLTEETRELVDESALGAMQTDTVLLNPSRGELVDEEAVLAALDSGKLAAYAADVLIGEPPAADHVFRHHPRVLLTPHAAFLSDASLRHYERDPPMYIAQWVETGRPADCIVGDPTRRHATN